VRQKEYAAAAAQLIDLLPYRPDDAPGIRLKAAQCYEAAGEFGKALAEYRNAAAGPDEVKALPGVARCLEALGRREDALEVLYDLATRFPPDRPEVADAESRLKAARRK
jgi:tetratricopeptide (TPR) repeat protein